MTTETIIANTKQMIDNLKTVCANFGLGNASSEYKIITEIFLYKFFNDKFLYEVQQADKTLKDSANVEKTLNDMSDDDYEMLMMLLPPATAKLKRKHFISYLFNHKNDEKFNELFDSTLWDISNTNLDYFTLGNGTGDMIRFFDGNLTQNVKDTKGAIGYVALSYLTGDAGVATVAIDGAEPTLENTYAGKYPVWTFAHMSTKGEPDEVVSAFLDYIMSDEYGAKMESLGYGVSSKMTNTEH